MLSSQKDCIQNDKADNDISKTWSINELFHGIAPFDQKRRWLKLATALLFRGLFSLAAVVIFLAGA